MVVAPMQVHSSVQLGYLYNVAETEFLATAWQVCAQSLGEWVNAVLVLHANRVASKHNANYIGIFCYPWSR